MSTSDPLREYRPKLDRKQCRKMIKQLGLPPIVRGIFEGRAIPEELRYRCDSPYYIFEHPYFPKGIQITPLWECGITTTAYHHLEPRGHYIEFSLETPEEYEDFGESFQSRLADLFIFLWEDVVPENRLRELALMFEFNWIEELLAGCVATNNADYEERIRWHKEFVRSCK